MSLHVRGGAWWLAALATASACVADREPVEGEPGAALGEASQASLAFDGDVGWTWAHWPSTGHYTPNPGWTYNNSGGAVDIYRDGVGQYRVVFAGLTSDRGNVHVVGYGPDANRCKVAGWWPSGGMTVFVRCHTPGGVLADTQFVAYYAETLATEGAYLWSSNPSASHTASWYYSYNSAGQPNLVEWHGVGMYRVRLKGLDHATGHALVTAYGADATHCKPIFWGAHAGDTIVDVRCFNAAGGRANSLFTLRYVMEDIGYYRLGYAWLDQPTTASYAPNPLYSFNSEGNPNQAVRTEPGRYIDSFPGLPFGDVAPLVSSYEDNARYCKIAEWRGHDTWLQVHVDCYTPAGARADSAHDTFAVGWKPECWTVCDPVTGVCTTTCV